MGIIPTLETSILAALMCSCHPPGRQGAQRVTGGAKAQGPAKAGPCVSICAPEMVHELRVEIRKLVVQCAEGRGAPPGAPCACLLRYHYLGHFLDIFAFFY